MIYKPVALELNKLLKEITHVGLYFNDPSEYEHLKIEWK